MFKTALQTTPNHSPIIGGWWEELLDDRLIVMSGMESMEQSQKCGFHMFVVFDTVT